MTARVYKCRICGGRIDGDSVPKRVGPAHRERHEHWAWQSCARETARLRRALRSVVIACEYLRHDMRDQHREGDPCPVEIRLLDLLGAAGAGE